MKLTAVIANDIKYDDHIKEDVGWEQKMQEATAELMKERKRNKIQGAEMAMWTSFCKTGRITNSRLNNLSG